ncbi:ATP-binding protein [Aestuariispira insulae]|uniref:histidine kinase n=1 Tax=Aestuariispira insulae TaxID=1461337 RepID=A0A3D9HVE4_9PROT|nr:ATP-binding protein [Aestuariispira insulae]RED53462.1 HAMP domain-containing protein [Aestuariispira insulae]
MFNLINSIRAKLLSVVLPLIAISMISLFALLEYAGITSAQENLQQRLVQNTKVQALALASPLWNYDIRAISPILLALEQDPDFLYVTVRDFTGEEVASLRASGVGDVPVSVSKTLPIVYSASDHEEIIGSVTVALHGERMRQEVFSRLQRNALILIILTAVIVAATVIATERTIGYPLRELMNSIELVKNSDIRTPVEWTSTDELGEVVKAYNEMLKLQANAENAMRESEERARESEARLRDAVNSMSDGFALFDENDRLVLYNKKFVSLTPRVAQVVQEGAYFEDIVRAGVAANHFPGAEGREDVFVAEQLEAHRKYNEQKVLRLDDGRWILCTEHGTSAGGTVAVRTDITELKKREMELQMAKEDADAANQAKSRFLANMSHELRTPLNAILGFSDIIRMEMLGQVGRVKYKEYADDIFTSGSHLLDLINDILDVSKIEAGAFTPRDDIIDLPALLSDCTRFVEYRARNKRIELGKALTNGIPVLRADKRAVKQVLLNLVTNAIKFTPEEGKVVVGAQVNEAQELELYVSDTGLGMSGTDIETVMQPFGRLDSPWTQSEEGTGLGLPLSDMLMDAHGGKLKIDSIPGKGTTVFAIFPKDRLNYDEQPVVQDDRDRA